MHNPIEDLILGDTSSITGARFPDDQLLHDLTFCRQVNILRCPRRSFGALTSGSFNMPAAEELQRVGGEQVADNTRQPDAS